MAAVNVVTSASVNNNTSDANDVSFAIAPSSTDRLLWLFVVKTQSVTITAKFNGVSMTALGTAGPTNGVGIDTFYLIAPDTTSHNVVISKSGNTKIVAVAVALENVNQTVPTGTVGFLSGQNNAPNADVTLGANDLALAGVAWDASESGVTEGSGQTAITNNANGSSLLYVSKKTGTGTVNISWNGSGGVQYMIASYPILSNANDYARSLSDSIMNAASRLATVVRVFTGSRSLADSITNAASRLATVGRVKGIVRALSDSLMNAASRLVTLLSLGPKFTDQTKNSTSFSDQSKNSTSFSDQSKDTTIWTDQTKNQ